MTTSAERNLSIEVLIKCYSRGTSDVILNAMHKSKPQLHVKNLQKQQFTKSKIKNVRKFDLQGCWRYAQLHCEIHDKPLQTVQKQKNRGLRYTMSKSYVNTTTQRHVAKTESQQREELHTRTLQSATPCSSSASVSFEQSINN